MKNEKRIDSDNIIAVIKGTIRGKISVVFAVLGVVFLFGEFSVGAKGIDAFRPLIVFEILAVWMLSSAAKSIEAKQEAEKNKKRQNKLERIKRSATKCIGDYLYVNETDRTWCVPSAGLTEYAFSDLIDFNVIQDGETISSANILNAVAGGMIFGLAGTLVGANKTKTSKTCSKLQVQMNVNSISNPVIRIDLISDEVKRSSDQYKKAVANMEEITGVLRVIKSRNENK